MNRLVRFLLPDWDENTLFCVLPVLTDGHVASLLAMTAMIRHHAYSKHRVVARTKRGGRCGCECWKTWNFNKRACVLLLEIPVFQQSAMAVVLSAFSCFVLCGKTKNEVGYGVTQHEYHSQNWNLWAVGGHKSNLFCHEFTNLPAAGRLKTNLI